MIPQQAFLESVAIDNESFKTHEQSDRAGLSSRGMGNDHASQGNIQFQPLTIYSPSLPPSRTPNWPQHTSHNLLGHRQLTETQQKNSHWKAVLKRWVFKLALKAESVGRFLMSEGRSFQTEGARNWKEHSPAVLRLKVGGTRFFFSEAERRGRGGWLKRSFAER